MTLGQVAYETWAAHIPRYPDLQHTWDELSQTVKDGWEMVAQIVVDEKARRTQDDPPPFWKPDYHGLAKE